MYNLTSSPRISRADDKSDGRKSCRSLVPAVLAVPIVCIIFRLTDNTLATLVRTTEWCRLVINMAVMDMVRKALWRLFISTRWTDESTSY